MKSAAGQETDKTLCTIFNEVTREHPCGHLVSYKKMENVMCKRRKQTYPKLPTSIEELTGLLHEAPSLERLYKGQIKTHDDQRTCGIALGNNELMEYLATCDGMGFDGTFKTCPHLFYQMFTVFAIRGSHYFPAVVVLLEGKTYEMYLATFQFIKNLLPTFSPQFAMADWEQAARQAATATWPDLQVKGCF